jgi:hypothetical protein
MFSCPDASMFDLSCSHVGEEHVGAILKGLVQRETFNPVPLRLDMSQESMTRSGVERL